MKIALLTIHNAYNYGAVLQAYATQETLSKYGDVEIINYQNRYILKTYSIFNVGFNTGLIKGIVREVFLLQNKLKRKVNFERFISSKLKLSESVSEDFKLDDSYDVYVCGSDQIWNPKITNNQSEINSDYFFYRVPEKSKIISYASSLGNHRFLKEHETRAQELLARFSSLSVREKDGQEYLESLLEKKVTHVLDPTLLLSRDEWIERLKLKADKKEEYILVYTVPRSPLLKEVIAYYASKNIKIISVDPGLRKTGKVNKQVRSASPESFLELLLNAKLVITDSFHGVCFSINFKKDFIAVSSGLVSNRMKNILSITGLDNRLIENASQLKGIKNISDEEFETAHKRLDNERKNSILFLENALIDRITS